MVSLTSFIIGYYFLPVDDWLSSILGVVINDHAYHMSASQLLPVWFMLTYIFIQPYLNTGLKLELAGLREVNLLLKQRHSNEAPAGSSPIRFESGRTNFTLSSDSIRNVVVEDHYCYVHYKHQGEYTKRDVAMPLRDVQTLLPEDFMQVHRSHLVNLDYVRSIKRVNRRIRVILDGDYQVPVSRYRLDDALPRIRLRIE
jgi:DNA-binding LytR/AlgR family response regulator